MKRLLFLLSLSLLLFSLAATPLAALTPTYTVTGAYKSSHYHQNLQKITKTGDKAHDTVAAALSQLGYHEGNSQKDFHGANGAGTKNYTEYNRFIGTVGGSYSYAWCAAFVSWCLEVAEAGNAAGGRFTSCTLWVERLSALGLYSTRASGYIPKTGDLIFFRSSGTARASDHVGIVRYVQNGRVYTVEGNASNKVTLRDYALKDTYVVGYGRPQYSSTTLFPSPTALEDSAKGLYVVTYDFLNVREKPEAAAKRLGSLTHGTLIEVKSIQNGWGEITYQGKTAYVSLDYATFTTPVLYRVNYLANGGENAPPVTTYFSTDTATVSTVRPTLEGHEFLHWQDENGNRFAAGDALPQKSLTLTAVFTPVSENLPENEGGFAPDTGAPLPPEEAPGQAPSLDTLLPEDAPTAARKTAATEAGTVSGVLAALAGIWWMIKRLSLVP